MLALYTITEVACLLGLCIGCFLMGYYVTDRIRDGKRLTPDFVSKPFEVKHAPEIEGTLKDELERFDP